MVNTWSLVAGARRHESWRSPAALPALPAPRCKCVGQGLRALRRGRLTSAAVETLCWQEMRNRAAALAAPWRGETRRRGNKSITERSLRQPRRSQAQAHGIRRGREALLHGQFRSRRRCSTQDVIRLPAAPPLFDDEGTDALSPDQYEELTNWLVNQLLVHTSIGEVRRNVKLRGRTTTNQIDVLWEVPAADGEVWRVLFEARRYKRRIGQQDVHAFRSVVDDVDGGSERTLGVMVTTKGYQEGAVRVAAGYGVELLELRSPQERDLEHRVQRIQFRLQMILPRVENIQIVLQPGTESTISPSGLHQVASDQLLLRQLPDDAPVQLMEHLLHDGARRVEGDSPRSTELHLHFEPPALLEFDGRVWPLVEVSARYQEEVAEHEFALDGLENLRWITRSVFGSAVSWINRDGVVRGAALGDVAARATGHMRRLGGSPEEA